ncbi:MAG: bifunctional adenosylcobinamide kinase/adenosylcobinamide-phosphate guanylyltransferase [Oscillospiraceae bacterium]|nr:bifunctional adenosylcobinamide kinase/adenosylcobinamide-phosphate guanylyltransferase [Oscillospiraceae bacterium]
MDLIIGGAYQGKLDYAKKRYGLDDGDICTCTESDGISFGHRCIYRTEEFVMWCIRSGKDAVEFLEQHKEEWKDSVFICEDMFCGVVPLGADMRAWREMTGRTCSYLSSEAVNVIRIFCGLEQVLKCG